MMSSTQMLLQEMTETKNRLEKDTVVNKTLRKLEMHILTYLSGVCHVCHNAARRPKKIVEVKEQNGVQRWKETVHGAEKLEKQRAEKLKKEQIVRRDIDE